MSDAVATAPWPGRAKGVRSTATSTAAPPVAASAQELGRVVRNLLDNAIRHTPPGGRCVVDVGPTATTPSVSVIDSAAASPTDDLDHVFDARLPGRRRPHPGRDGGAGLGLAIARGFVEAHRGDIAVRNDGDGCRFTVRLPLA